MAFVESCLDFCLTLGKSEFDDTTVRYKISCTLTLTLPGDQNLNIQSESCTYQRAAEEDACQKALHILEPAIKLNCMRSTRSRRVASKNIELKQPQRPKSPGLPNLKKILKELREFSQTDDSKRVPTYKDIEDGVVRCSLVNDVLCPLKTFSACSYEKRAARVDAETKLVCYLFHENKFADFFKTYSENRGFTRF